MYIELSMQMSSLNDIVTQMIGKIYAFQMIYILGTSSYKLDMLLECRANTTVPTVLLNIHQIKIRQQSKSIDVLQLTGTLTKISFFTM